MNQLLRVLGYRVKYKEGLYYLYRRGMKTPLGGFTELPSERKFIRLLLNEMDFQSINSRPLKGTRHGY